MDYKTTLIRFLIAAGLSFASLNATAATGEGNATVISTLQDPVNYGGCMARISPGPSAITAYGGGNLNCPGDVFVTFDCLNSSGQTTKSMANSMFNTAQLAYVTGDTVNLVINDAVKINGFCLARRIDLAPR